jgi:hypothetical protein
MPCLSRIAKSHFIALDCGVSSCECGSLPSQGWKNARSSLSFHLIPMQYQVELESSCNPGPILHRDHFLKRHFCSSVP